MFRVHFSLISIFSFGRHSLTLIQASQQLLSIEKQFFSPSWVNVTYKPIRHFYKNSLHSTEDEKICSAPKGEWKREGQKKSEKWEEEKAFVIFLVFLDFQHVTNFFSSKENSEMIKQGKDSPRAKREINFTTNIEHKKLRWTLHHRRLLAVLFYRLCHQCSEVNMRRGYNWKQNEQKNIKKVTWNRNEHAKGLGMGENGIIFIVVFRKRLKGDVFQAKLTHLRVYHWNIIVFKFIITCLFCLFQFFLVFCFL